MRLSPHRCPIRSGQVQDERGVTIVEAAFALPVFLLFIFGLIDLGGAVLQTSQASSAAADGARAGSVLSDLTGAETSGPAHDKIVAAVKGRLVGAEADNAVIAIRCLSPAGTPFACGTSGAARDRSQIQVEVKWTWRPATGVGRGLPINEIAGSSAMGLVVVPIGYHNTASTTTTPTP